MAAYKMRNLFDIGSFHLMDRHANRAIQMLRFSCLICSPAQPSTSIAPQITSPRFLARFFVPLRGIKCELECGNFGAYTLPSSKIKIRISFAEEKKNSMTRA